MSMLVLVFQHALWVSSFMPLTPFQVSREKHKVQVWRKERRKAIYRRNTVKCVCSQHVCVRCVYVCASGIRAARAELVWWWLIFVTTHTCWHRMAQQFPPASPPPSPPVPVWRSGRPRAPLSSACLVTTDKLAHSSFPRNLPHQREKSTRLPTLDCQCRNLPHNWVRHTVYNTNWVGCL